MKCHYEVLGVSQTATDDDLKKAYRKMALKWHPDKNPDRLEEAKTQFQIIQAAYETLSDPQERAFYDRNRESILRGKETDGESRPDDINLFGYFTSQCYSGFNDSDKGFYTVYRQLFETIATKDMQYMDDEKEFEIPSFGGSEADLEDVAQFYGYWSSYCTSMSFAWVDEYDIREAHGMGRWVEKRIEKENSKVRIKARKEFNEQVRSLVAFVKRRDKRWEARKKLLEAKAEENREKQKAARQRKIDERQKSMEADVAQERAKMKAYEDELRALEAKFADEYSISDYEDSEGEEEEGEYLYTVEEEDEENEVEEDEVDYSMDDRYCVACNKEFKSVNAMESHCRSKKHRENLAKLKMTMMAEDCLINGEAEDVQKEESPEETEELQQPPKSSKKKKKKKNDTNDAPQPPTTTEPGKRSAKSKKKNKRQTFDFYDSNSEEEVMVLNETLKEEEDEGDKPAEVVNGSDIPEDPVSMEGDNADDVEKADDNDSVKQPPKLKGKKAKEARKQAKQAELAASGEKEVIKCTVCNTEFTSKNKLFMHIKAEGHAALKSAGPGGKKAKGKNKK